MLTGTIKFFNKQKGFGFITSDAGGKEVFLPSATVTASDLKKVEPGQRVSFQEEPDVKGPKAVSLTLLDEPRREAPKREMPARPEPRAAAIALYYDPASRSFDAVREALEEQKVETTLVDYTAVPPEPAELKKWSLALAGSDVGLVRRSDPMYFALDLDDRFISESDFWLAVSQHPTLINGPVLRMGNRLAVAKSADDVRRFLGMEAATAARPKGLSPRLSALIRGEALPPEEDDEIEDEIDEIEAEAPVAVKAEVEKPAKPVKTKPTAKVTATVVKKSPAAKAKAAAAKKPAAKKR